MYEEKTRIARQLERSKGHRTIVRFRSLPMHRRGIAAVVGATASTIAAFSLWVDRGAPCHAADSDAERREGSP